MNIEVILRCFNVVDLLFSMCDVLLQKCFLHVGALKDVIHNYEVNGERDLQVLVAEVEWMQFVAATMVPKLMLLAINVSIHLFNPSSSIYEEPPHSLL